MELKSSTPYIDFHYGSSTADYTSRIIENNSGTLSISGNLYVNGIISSGTPKIYDKLDSSASAAAGWAYIGTGINVPAGTYIVMCSAEGPDNSTNFQFIGLSYQDYVPSYENGWVGTRCGGFYVGTRTVSQDTNNLRVCVYSYSAISYSNIRITAIRIC